MSSGQRRSSEHYASAGGQQSGFVYDIESEGLSIRREHGGGPPSSRSQQQVVLELNAANLARVDEQALVRGPLKQLETASEQVMASVHAMNQELDQLNSSILGCRQVVEDLRERITIAQSTGQWVEVDGLTTQEANNLARIQQDEERRQVLLNQLEHGRQSVDRTLHGLNLFVYRGGGGSSANQPSYPAHADQGMAEDTEVVPEGDRPHLDFQ